RLVEDEDHGGDLRASLADRYQGRRTVAGAARARELHGERGLHLDALNDHGVQLCSRFFGNRTERQDPDTRSSTPCAGNSPAGTTLTCTSHTGIISATEGAPNAGLTG